ncbi:MAG TPA: response regulator [Roseiflexaceae bacterium]|nr:response regulator [Roseiflexaceae bacterium]
MPQSRHILLVDDHADVRAVLTHLITRLCPTATIAQAVHGVDALQSIEEHEPYLIITDCQMPIMDGLEFVRALRAQGAVMPIVAISSDPRLSDAVRKAGADAFLLKPFQLGQLTQQLYALAPGCREIHAVGE